MTIIKASILFSMALFASSNAIALNDDIKKQAIIASNNQKVDIAKNFAVFSGDVTIKQGSILISAERLEIFNHGHSGKEVMILTGNPAKFSQDLEQGDKVTAHANQIRFERANNIIRLSKNAQLQQNESLVRSQSISYDMARKLLIANGNTNEKLDANKRVTTILEPTNDDEN